MTNPMASRAPDRVINTPAKRPRFVRGVKAQAATPKPRTALRIIPVATSVAFSRLLFGNRLTIPAKQMGTSSATRHRATTQERGTGSPSFRGGSGSGRSVLRKLSSRRRLLNQRVKGHRGYMLADNSPLAALARAASFLAGSYFVPGAFRCLRRSGIVGYR